jgi:hypothetical protein
MVSGRWYAGPHEVDVNIQLLADTRLRVGDRLRLKVNGKPVTVRIAGEIFAPVPMPTLFASWRTLGHAASTLPVDRYDVNHKPGTSTRGYVASLSHALGSAYFVLTPSGPSFAFNIRPSYFRLLAHVALEQSLPQIETLTETVMHAASQRREQADRNGHTGGRSHDSSLTAYDPAGHLRLRSCAPRVCW